MEKIPVADVLSIFIDDRPDLYVENSDAQKYLNRIGRLSFASETSRKEEDERRQNSMKMGISSGNAASFHRS